jgi:hypothetical protein
LQHFKKLLSCASDLIITNSTFTMSSDQLISIAKDWLAGGVSAGVSKTIVAPIGERSRPRILPASWHEKRRSFDHAWGHLTL